MLAFVAQLFDNGQPLPPTQSILSLPVKAGDLELSVAPDDTAPARAARVAVRDFNGADVLPPILDAVIERFGESTLRITGTVLARAGARVPQAWFVQLYDE